MLKLRTILLRKELFFIILFISIFVSIIRIIIPHNITISNKYSGSLKEYSIDGDKLVLRIKNVQATYYIKTKEELNKLNKLQLGNSVTIIGDFKIPDNINYYKSKNIDIVGSVSTIRIYGTNHLYVLKNIFRNRLNNNPYLYTFLLGDKSYLSTNVLRSYQTNGISHLFAISGMHISLLSGILLKILKKIQEETRYKIVSLFLIIYLIIVGPSPSILRGVLFFILFSINNIYYLEIKNTHLFILALSITLLYNPYYIYDTGFQYSFSISYSLLINQKFLQTNNYIKGLFKTSIISLLSSIPISLYHNNSLNLASIFYNLLYVPFISYLIFPLSLICIIFPFLQRVLNPLTNLLETSSLYLEKNTLLIISFPHFNIILYLIYFLIILISYYKDKVRVILLILLIIQYIYPYLDNNTYLYMIDVGQGDSFLLIRNKHSILIDTGGIQDNTYEEWKRRKKNYSLVENKTIPILNSRGVNSLETLIITHGDNDHIGEANKLVKSIKVKNIIINCGIINYLEKELIKNRKYKQCISYLYFGNTKIYFLQTKDYNNENENSNVIYTEIDNVKMLFMGDAGVKKEKDILKEYAISNIDILKVGHHGSITSSSEEFIKVMNPTISLISVGENNKYGHPDKIVLNRLKDSTIFRTDQDKTTLLTIENKKIYAQKNAT